VELLINKYQFFPVYSLVWRHAFRPYCLIRSCAHSQLASSPTRLISQIQVIRLASTKCVSSKILPYEVTFMQIMMLNLQLKSSALFP
jgi:hypothetical protein